MLVDVTAQPNASAAPVGEVSNPSLQLVKIRLQRRQAGTLGTTRVEAQLPPVRATGRRALAGLPFATGSLSISNYEFGVCVLCVWGVAPQPSPHRFCGVWVCGPPRPRARPQKPPTPTARTHQTHNLRCSGCPWQKELRQELDARCPEPVEAVLQPWWCQASRPAASEGGICQGEG